MKIELLAREALANSRANPNRAWLGSDGDAARVRLTDDAFLPVGHRPKFMLDRAAPIFTIGSCFARNVENTLVQNNLPMLLKPHGIPAEEYDSWNEATQRGGGVAAGQLSRGAFNKYNVHSMSHDLRRVILGESLPDDGLIELKPGHWFDPHASSLRHGEKERVLANRRRIHAGMAEIRNAKVMFMTLGLTETWLDRETGIAMNAHPGPAWLARKPDRFAFLDYGFQGILEEMEALIALVREHCCPDMRFIVTVSPVPLGTTFKSQDIIVANSGSKATLRAVAEELYRRHDFVDYFPSYEIVTNTKRALAWEDDQIHVNPALVKYITDSFVGLYYAKGEALAA